MGENCDLPIAKSRRRYGDLRINQREGRNNARRLLAIYQKATTRLKITNKMQMYELYEKGEFGNKFPCWNNLANYLASGYEEPVALRHKSVKPGGFFLPDLTKEDVEREIKSRQLRVDEIHITACAPDDLRTIQGETQESLLGFDLYYSDLKMPMRYALARGGKTEVGFKAMSILHSYMDGESYVNLVSLFERFPDHVVEFTCFRKSVGELRWNTVFWEVRCY